MPRFHPRRARASLDTMSPTRPREPLDALAGVGVMGLALVSPFLRSRRGHWGMDPALAARPLPGDDLVPAPSWSWSHGIVVAARPEVVWPWVAQIGADRAGFYSYAALENLVGCGVRNAERIHPEWQEREGTTLVLHPKAPPLPIVEARPGGHLVAFGRARRGGAGGGPAWIAASWLLMVAPARRREQPRHQPLSRRPLGRPPHPARLRARPARADRLRHGPPHADRHPRPRRAGSRRHDPGGRRMSATRILVTAASRHEATMEIAEEIGAELRRDGPQRRRPPHRGGLRPRGLRARRARERHLRGALARAGAGLLRPPPRRAARPARSGSSAAARLGDPPKPTDDPGSDIADLVPATGAREHRIFPGRLDRHELGHHRAGRGGAGALAGRRLPPLARDRRLGGRDRGGAEGTRPSGTRERAVRAAAGCGRPRSRVPARPLSRFAEILDAGRLPAHPGVVRRAWWRRCAAGSCGTSTPPPAAAASPR